MNTYFAGRDIVAVSGDAGVVFEDSGFLKAESPLWICSPGIWCGVCGGAEILSRDRIDWGRCTTTLEKQAREGKCGVLNKEIATLVPTDRSFSINLALPFR